MLLSVTVVGVVAPVPNSAGLCRLVGGGPDGGLGSGNRWRGAARRRPIQKRANHSGHFSRL